MQDEQSGVTGYRLTDEDRRVIADLVAHQTQLGLTQSEFAKRYLSYSATVWGRVVSGEYFGMTKEPEKVIRTLTSDLRSLEETLIQEARYSALNFVRHPDAELVIRAIKECRGKLISNPDRVVMYVAPTGGGKSALCGYLRSEGARLVEARESWLRSYFACVRDIANACGVNPDNYYSPDTLEEQLMRILNSRRTTLVIDEGEFFSSRTLNLVKLVVNKSAAVVVICCMPEAYDRWSTRNWHEASQIKRRTHAMIRCAPCDIRTARMFLTGFDLDESAARAAAGFARAFGMFDTLVQIRTELQGETTVDAATMIKAGNRVRAFQGLTPLFAEK